MRRRASINRPCRPSSLRSGRAVIAVNIFSAAARSPDSCADCAPSSSVSGSCGASLPGFAGISRRAIDIAGADRNQPMRDRVMALRRRRALTRLGDARWRVHDRDERQPPQSDQQHSNSRTAGKHRNRRRNAMFEPDDLDAAGPVDEPAGSERRRSQRAQRNEQSGSWRTCTRRCGDITTQHSFLRDRLRQARAARAVSISPRGGERGLPGLRSRDPARRPARAVGGKLRQIGKRTVDIRPRAALYSTRAEDRRRVVAGRVADRANAHQPARA